MYCFYKNNHMYSLHFMFKYRFLKTQYFESITNLGHNRYNCYFILLNYLITNNFIDEFSLVYQNNCFKI